MIYLKVKKFFRDNDLRGLIEMAKISEINLGMAKLFLESVITYSKKSNIEYTTADKLLAQKMLQQVNKIKIESKDEFD